MSTTPRTRLKFDRIEERSARGEHWTEATLTFDGRTIVGASPHAGELEPRTAVRRSALATLDAVVKFVDGQFTCELHDADHVQALGKDLVVLLITIHFEGRAIQLFGSCRAGDDLEVASARAALNATNRYIEIVLQKRSDG